MTRVTIFDTRREGRRDRRLLDLAARDWAGLAAVALVSTVLSLLATVLSGGTTPDALLPALVIPLVVSIPASAVVFGQRRLLADVNRQMLELLQSDPFTGLLSRRFFLAGAEAEARRQGGALLPGPRRWAATGSALPRAESPEDQP